MAVCDASGIKVKGTMRVHSSEVPFARILRLVAVCILQAGLFSVGVRAQIPSPARALPTLTSANQIRSLSTEQASLGYPVRVRGVITMDAPAPDFFVQDATAGIYVEGSTSPRFSHSLGQLVKVEGITGPGKFAPVIRELKVQVLGDGVLPQAQTTPFSALANGQQDSQRAKVRGIVRSAAIDRDSWSEPALAMRIVSEGGEFNVRVPIAHEQDFSSWVDSEVSIEGVCGSLYNSKRQLTGILFYVPRLRFIRLEAPANEVPLSGLLRFAPMGGMLHRVHIQWCRRLSAAGQRSLSPEWGPGTQSSDTAKYAC